MWKRRSWVRCAIESMPRKGENMQCRRKRKILKNEEARRKKWGEKDRWRGRKVDKMEVLKDRKKKTKPSFSVLGMGLLLGAFLFY
jgi:hypothetical protein